MRSNSIVLSIFFVFFLFFVTTIPVHKALAQSEKRAPCIGSLTPFAAAVSTDANLRDGPGTNYKIAGYIRMGAEVAIVKGSANGNWCQLNTGKWISAYLVKKIKPASSSSPATPTKVFTETIEPTPSPVPTGSSGWRPGLSISEIEYLKNATVTAKMYFDSMSSLTLKMLEIRKDPSVMVDKKWRQSALDAMSLALAISTQLEELNPPASMAHIGSKLESVDGYFILSIQHYSNCIKDIDIAELDAGYVAMVLGSNSTLEAVELIKEYVVE